MEETDSKDQIISETSIDADLIIVGFRYERIRTEGSNIFSGYENLSNTLFVSSNPEKELTLGEE